MFHDFSVQPLSSNENWTWIALRHFEEKRFQDPVGRAILRELFPGIYKQSLFTFSLEFVYIDLPMRGCCGGRAVSCRADLRAAVAAEDGGLELPLFNE